MRKNTNRLLDTSLSDFSASRTATLQKHLVRNGEDRCATLIQAVRIKNFALSHKKELFKTRRPDLFLDSVPTWNWIKAAP